MQEMQIWHGVVEEAARHELRAPMHIVECFTVVLGVRRAGLIHIWVSIAEGKWSKRSEKLDVLFIF